MEKEAEKIADTTEANKIWQEYLQKCCEVGQLEHAVEELESQKLQIEKNIEVTKRAVKSLANQHKQNKHMGLVPTPQPTAETQTDGSLQ